MVMLHIKIIGNRPCSNILANILPAAPLPDSGDQKVKFNLAEHGHVAYQIKGNRKCSHIETNIIHAAPLPSTRPWGSKG